MRRLIFIILLITACTQQQPKKIKPVAAREYSIKIFLNDSSSAHVLKDTLRTMYKDTVISFIQDGKFVTQLGFYASGTEAANRGFELFADSLIESYRIYKSDSLIDNPYGDFYFVGQYQDHPSLYRINLFSKKVFLVWNKWGRKIIKIDRSPENSAVYLTTALTWGIKAGFPSITNLRLYLKEKDGNKVKFINKFGNGLAANSTWENDSTFAFYFTALDSMTTSTVYEKKHEYNDAGKLINRSDKDFDLVKDGIQIPNLTEISAVSPGLSYTFSLAEEDSSGILTLENNIDGTEVRVCSTYTRIIDAEWTLDESYLFLTTQNISNRDSTDLMIVSTKDAKLVNKFRGEGEKSFIVRGNLLIFDDGFGKASDIIFYRYKKNQIYYRFQITGGCGIKHIPSREILF